MSTNGTCDDPYARREIEVTVILGINKTPAKRVLIAFKTHVRGRTKVEEVWDANVTEAKMLMNLNPGKEVYYHYSELESLRAKSLAFKGALDGVLKHLNNGHTSQNEALCLIRRDTEEALKAFDEEK